MKFRKTFALVILSGIISGLTIQISYGQINKNTDSIYVKKMIGQLKSDPVINFEAAYWFSQLPFDEKIKYSDLIGQIVLTNEDTTSFVLAFGAKKSPYPWALKVETNSIDLSTDNLFVYIFRNDRYIQNQWGGYWTWKKYNTKMNNTGPIFIEEKSIRSLFRDIWLPASGWRYVGPELEISKDTLNADKNLINTGD